MNHPFTPVDVALQSLELKKMEASMLARCIAVSAHQLGLDVDEFEEAVAIAGYAHRDQTRKQRGSMPRVHYIEHPLRNTVRLFRYGVSDRVTLLASILHDTVEDGPQELSMLGGVNPGNIQEARAGALAFIADRFGQDVADTVNAVTNPILPKDMARSEKNRHYLDHVAELVEKPRPALVKLSDFVDNCASLHHTIAPENRGMTLHLATKYEPLLEVFTQVLDGKLLGPLLPGQGALVARMHLESARVNIRDIKAQPADA